MRLKKYRKYIAAAGLLPLLLVFVSSGPVFAASVNYNDLIDDVIFDNSSSMTADQINAFLNGFSGSCISPNSGFQAPDPTGYAPGSSFSYGSNVTAGQVIYDAAQAYQINPQVLLATMQKEQSLVTGGGGCGTLAYTAAMGYNCPDGGSTYNYSSVDLYTLNGHEVTSVNGTCVSNKVYAGFSQQVINAAWLLKFDRERAEGNVTFYINTPDWNNSDDLEMTYTGYMTQGTYQRQESLSSTYYDGDATIDSTSVQIDNGATAALYDYTPHLSGDSNFDTIFSEWFGPVLTSGFAWQYVSQGVYTDSSETTPQNPTQLVSGQRYYVTVEAKNVGSQAWTSNIVHLATSHPTGSSSPFYDYSWPSADRSAAINQTVAPGSTGSFSFWITAPKNTGKTPVYYKQYFQPVADGYAWMTDYGLNWQFDVQPQRYTWQDVGQGAYTDQTETTPVNLSYVDPGQRIYLTLSALNTGDMTWNQNNTNLAPTHLSGESPFYDGTWLSPNRPARLNQGSVAPGQVGTFSFWVQVPFNKSGWLREYFQPVVEGVTWMQDIGQNWLFGVPTPQYTWQYLTQGAYTDSTKTTAANLSDLSPGQRVYLSLTVKNTGNVIWYPGRINLAIAHPTNNSSPIYDSTWMTANRSGTIAAVTDPGQTTTFNFWATAPSKPGSYRQYFVPVADGIKWFPDYGLNWVLTVQ